MRKNLFFASLLVGLAILCSCGGKKKSNEVVIQKDKVVDLKPFDTKTKGYLSNVLEVVDGTYTLTYKVEKPTKANIQVKIKSISKGNPNDYSFSNGSWGPLHITICDKNGTPVASFPSLRSSYQSNGLLKDMMTQKDENWILFDDYTFRDTLPDNCTTFIITSKKIEKSEDDSSSDEVSSESSDTGDKKFDKLLDDFEAYTDKYIKMIKKVENDNMGALLDYPDLIKQTKKLEKSLEEAKNSKNLSSSQMKRLMDIQMKMLDATSEMGENN